jgi:hypothetical protein
MPSDLPFRNAFMPAVRHHDTLWHTSVALSSKMNQIFEKTPVENRILKHKGETIRAINTCLQDPSTQITDETIAAILGLATVEVSCR